MPKGCQIEEGNASRSYAIKYSGGGGGVKRDNHLRIQGVKKKLETWTDIRGKILLSNILKVIF